jgi:hypothetical protein
MLFIGPSPATAHASVANSARVSSAAMPAAEIAKRCPDCVSFQLSPVSVYSTGHMTRKATPIVGTRSPKCFAEYAWPSSWITFANVAATA